MTKTFQLIFSQITTNNKNIYHVIYDNLHKADATVFVFVDTDKSTLDSYCEAFKYFYDEPNIFFIGIEKDPSNITPELIDVAIDALNIETTNRSPCISFFWFIIGFIGYGSFLYSLFLAFAVSFALYRLASIYVEFETRQTDKTSNL